MRLIPKRSPGRVSRKTQQHEQDVPRLRAEGYTLNAIREALFDPGITFSLANLRRKVKRAYGQRSHAHTQAIPSATTEASRDSASVPITVASPSLADAISGLPDGLADRDGATASSGLDGRLSASSSGKVFAAFFLGRPV